MKSNIRAIALKLLLGYESEGRYVNLLLNTQEAKALSQEDRARLTLLLYTTVENKLRYDYYIAALSKRPVDKIEPEALNAMRLGLCQIFDIDNIPDHAAVNETVSLLKNPGVRALANAVLRAAVRCKDNPPMPNPEKSYKKYLSVKYSFPKELVGVFFEIFGEEDTEELLAALSKKAPLSITVNTKITDRDRLLSKLEGLGATAAKYSENGVIINKSIAPVSIPGFAEGEFFVQDEASRLAVEALAPKQGERIIDVCSAPGGKSFYAAMTAGEVYSFDLHESKLSLIKSGVLRLGVDNIRIECVDATQPRQELFAGFDALICDVPCSGLGVIAKKPDLKYKKDITGGSLPRLQYEILEKSVAYLKPGGRLIYSTCTVNPEENERVTDKFIENHPSFRYEKIELGEISSDKGYITLLPHIHGTDGFFIASIRHIEG